MPYRFRRLGRQRLDGGILHPNLGLERGGQPGMEAQLPLGLGASTQAAVGLLQRQRITALKP
jgi:hypothetical protein